MANPWKQPKLSSGHTPSSSSAAQHASDVPPQVKVQTSITSFFTKAGSKASPEKVSQTSASIALTSVRPLHPQFQPSDIHHR